ncbi:MAG: alpha/beta hydrolase [Burkholderiaceae bacterium]
MSAGTVMHPDMQLIIAARTQAGARGVATTSPAEFREYWRNYSRLFHEPCPPDMEVHDQIVQSNGLSIPVRIYRPTNAVRPCPVVMYMHGGGFVAGDLDSSETSAWGYAAQIGAVVVSVDYRLAPEFPYPAQLNDCWSVLQWIPSQAGALGIDPHRIAVTGESAGGTLSAALALKARDQGGTAIACAAMIYPWAGPSRTAADDPPSYREFADSPSLSRASMQRYQENYLQNEKDFEDPLARPAIADLAGLPPFWVHTGGMDPLRDDGRIFAAKLASAGGDVQYREAPGMLHGFMRARVKGPGVRREYDALCAFLARELGLRQR